MSDVILVLNAGSSSLKFQALSAGDPDITVRLRGQIEGIGTRPRLSVTGAHGRAIEERDLALGPSPDRAACLGYLAEWLSGALTGSELVGVGHRVVHGGVQYAAPVRIDANVLAHLEKLVPLAPLHQPHNLAPIRALLASRPDLPQVACFDTAFHRTNPEVAQLFGLPYRLFEDGVRRYGFHGLSYEFVANRLGELAPDLARGRVIVAHLGSGASLCALHAGRSIASTMGFTALDGLPMGTRSGSIDAGVVIYLGRDLGMSLDAVERLLYSESGLLGISGVSNDMRDLLQSDAPAAGLAVDYFVYRIAREIGSLAAALGGIDGLVFTAGIGENSPEIRAMVCERARWLGVELDAALNERRAPRISSAASRVPVWIIPTNEELVIARHTLGLLGSTREAASSETPMPQPV
jgi:acetate kinase